MCVEEESVLDLSQELTADLSPVATTAPPSAIAGEEEEEEEEPDMSVADLPLPEDPRPLSDPGGGGDSSVDPKVLSQDDDGDEPTPIQI